MARLDRNRGMFFGSWTGEPIAQAASATVSGTGITAATVTASTFAGKVSKSGKYIFSYDGTNWKLNGNNVTLNDYGISVTGTAVSGDTITVDYTKASSGWEAIGKDNDDLSKEMNPDTESGKNVLGESTFTHSGYEPQVDVDPYYMDPDRHMYAHMLECALQEKSGEADLLGKFAEAFFTTVNTETKTMSGYCYVRDAWFVPQSVGGDTSGYAIPYTITPVGAMVKKNISYSMETNEATITEISAG